MADYLVRNEVARAGYQDGGGAVPPATMVPWACTPDGRVVWTAPATGLGPPAARTGLVPYNAQVQRERRALAEAVLGATVIQNPEVTGGTLRKVSQGIVRYWQKRRSQLSDLVSSRGITETRKYTYGDTSFGRVGSSDQVPLEFRSELEYQLAALFAPWPQRVMNVHDNWLRIFKLLGPTDTGDGPASRVWANPGLSKPELDNVERLWQRKSAQWRRMEEVGNTVRPKELFDPSKRGRTNVAPVPGGTTTPGGVTAGLLNMQACLDRLKLGQMEFRRRGVDMYLPDMTVPTPFLDSVTSNNLYFGAGPSGTTGTVFQAGILFGGLQGEELKQYLLGIVAYLVAGGMHSCHEVFTVAKLLGIPYDDGKYYATMPTEFRKSKLYDDWQTEFWDIAATSKTYRPFV